MSGDIDLVTGGAGFIGRHLVRALLARGGRVRVIDPDAGCLLPRANVEAWPGSVLDRALLDAACRGVRHVYHLGGIAHLWRRNPGDFDRVNHQGTVAVLAAARRAGVEKLIVTATETILRGWNDSSPMMVRLSDPMPALAAMAGPYTRSKWLADAAAREAAAAGQPVVMLYPTVPVGAGDDNFTSPTRMIHAFLMGRASAYLDCTLNLIAVEDVAHGHVLAADHGKAGGRYILAGENVAMARLLDQLGRISGLPMPRRQVPYQLAALVGQGAEWMANHVTGAVPLASLEGVRLARYCRDFDPEPARSELGFDAGPIEPALRRAVGWLVGRGWVQIPKRAR